MVVHSYKPRACAWKVAIVATNVLLVDADGQVSILLVACAISGSRAMGCAKMVESRQAGGRGPQATTNACALPLQGATHPGGQEGLDPHCQVGFPDGDAQARCQLTDVIVQLRQHHAALAA
jgi:hypothetical protein